MLPFDPSIHPIEHFCCQNAACADAGRRGAGNLMVRGSGR